MKISVRTIALILAVIAVFVWLFTLTRPDPPGPEAAIAQMLADGVAALEDGDTGDVLDLVSNRFRGEIASENLDRGTLGDYLRYQFLRGGGIDVSIVSQDIELINPEEAVVMITVVGTRGGMVGALGGDADAMGVELRVVIEDDEWKVVEAFERPVTESML